jgi:hypothetical protein
MDTDIAKTVERCGGNLHKAAAELGIPRTTLRRRIAAGKTEVPVARTIADFRREHDQAWKIRDGIERLFDGGVIMTDAEFREAVSGHPSRWRASADASEFRENRYRVKGELFWASKETIREMRRICGEAI